MHCEHFEHRWQMAFDRGEDPKSDPDLVAHALLCDECHELLIGGDKLLECLSAFPSARGEKPGFADQFVSLQNASGSAEPPVLTFGLHSKSTQQPNFSSRPIGSSFQVFARLAIAATLFLIVGGGLWGRAWLDGSGLTTIGSNHASQAEVAVHVPTITKRSQPKADMASQRELRKRIDESVPPLSATPASLAMQAPTTGYFVSMRTIEEVTNWRHRWPGVQQAPGYLLRDSFGPLTQSLEAAFRSLRASIYGFTGANSDDTDEASSGSQSMLYPGYSPSLRNTV